MIMKDTRTYRDSAGRLLLNAKAEAPGRREGAQHRRDNMGLARAGFHYVPEIVHHSLEKDKTRVARVTGLYACGDGLWLIEEDRSPVSVDAFYNPGSEVRAYGGYAHSRQGPHRTRRSGGGRGGLHASGSLEEWLTVADCYFRGLGGMRLR